MVATIAVFQLESCLYLYFAFPCFFCLFEFFVFLNWAIVFILSVGVVLVSVFTVLV